MSAGESADDRSARGDGDAGVLSRIDRLVREEHKLFGRVDLSHEDGRRLAEVQGELDRCWDLLRQRRALREFGLDPSEARLRSADVVKKYVG